MFVPLSWLDLDPSTFRFCIASHNHQQLRTFWGAITANTNVCLFASKQMAGREARGGGGGQGLGLTRSTALPQTVFGLTTKRATGYSDL